MKKLSGKIFGVIATVLLSVGTMQFGVVKDYKAADLNDSKIVIVSTNDAHCNIDAKEDADSDKAYLGYTGVAAVYKEKKGIYSNVALVDAGDHIQGSSIGLLTKGQDIINIMNKVGYTVSTLGNHEFDYGIDRLFELTHPTSSNPLKANYPYVCCNFVKLSDNSTVYDPYVMENYTYNGTNKKVAYVGITTPETIALSSDTIFSDANGNHIYGFCQDETGEKLYAQIQKYVDAARVAGADYVIALGHIGQDGKPDKWRSDTIVKNTNGIDAFIDGHSHEKYIQKVANKDGKEIYVTQTGSQLNAVGLLTIDMTSGEVTVDVVQALVSKDLETENYIADIKAKYMDELNKKIAETRIELVVYKKDSNNWLVRESETNMSDLVTDALRVELGTDIAIMTGGGIRNKIEQGDISFNQALSVLPFNNEVTVIRASGQQLLDALEMGAMKYPQASGGFMHVSGMSYEIAQDIPSSVKTDDKGLFVAVEGQYRVRNVKVGEEPLDLYKMYTVGGSDYNLLQSGDGLSMFKGCESLISSGKKDIEVFSEYLRKIGIVGEEYANVTGQGRIRFVKANEQPGEDSKVESKDEPNQNANNQSSTSDSTDITSTEDTSAQMDYATIGKDTPSTGNDSMMMFYSVLMLVSGLAVTRCAKKEFRK